MNNDLISREDLRKNMEFICMGIMAGTEPYNAPLTEIDNAPTVPNEYMRGYEAAEREYKRPQGEWNPIDAFVVRCSVCGVESFATPFCPKCGADMRKGGNELKKVLDKLKERNNG